MRYKDGREYSLLEPLAQFETPNKKEQLKIFVYQLALVCLYLLLIYGFEQLVYFVAGIFIHPPKN